MKKGFLVAAMAATLVLSGCSEDETINQSSGELIQFKMLAAGSRAAQKGISDIQTSGFDVFAFYDSGSGEYTTSYMGRTAVSYSAPDWVYSPLKYWPTDKDLVFYAYDKVIQWDGIPANEATYVAPNGKEAGVDALVTKTGNLNTPGVKVPLVFHHALSQVVVSARSGRETVDFEIKKVTLTNVLPNGKVSLLGWSPAIPEASTVSGNGLDWTAEGTAATYELGLNTAATTVGYNATDYTNITSDAGPLFLIPQQLKGGAPLTISAPWTGTNSDTYLVVEYEATDSETDVVLNATTTAIPVATNLLPGIRYHFRLTLNGYGVNGPTDPTNNPDGEDNIKPIEFTADVTPWVETIIDLTL